MLMTIEDFKYIFENRNIKIVFRDKAHSMRLSKGDYCYPNAMIPGRAWKHCEESIDVFARFWENGTVTNWKQIDIHPTKESIESYVNTTQDVVHLKLEIPQHEFIIRILGYIFEKQYNKDVCISIFDNKFYIINNMMNGKEGLKSYNGIILKCDDPNWEIKSQLTSYDVFKDNLVLCSKSVDVILWTDEHGIISDNIRNWKKLKLLTLQNCQTMKHIKLSAPSELNRSQFVSFINCLQFLRNL